MASILSAHFGRTGNCVTLFRKATVLKCRPRRVVPWGFSWMCSAPRCKYLNNTCKKASPDSFRILLYILYGDHLAIRQRLFWAIDIDLENLNSPLNWTLYRDGMGEWRHRSMHSNLRRYGCEMMYSTPRLICYLAIAPCSDGIEGYVVLRANVDALEIILLLLWGIEALTFKNYK